MKVILSRKGFDSSNGGIPSPIMPDGTLLSMPIPLQDDAGYSDIQWNGKTYAEILKDLSPKRNYEKCHIDPDIRNNRVKSPTEWRPAFGQIGAAQGLLNNAGVEPGDLFLFFGWFRHTEETENGYRYIPKNKYGGLFGKDLHVVYGYMQIGEIVSDQERIKEYYWHPHSSSTRCAGTNNTLYLPTEKLSFLPGTDGYGTLSFRPDRVLTMDGMNRGTWKDYSFLRPEHICGKRKNAAQGKGIYYPGIWQELVIYESPELLKWVMQIIN